MGETMKKEKIKVIISKIKIASHFMTTVLMYSVCLIMCLVFLVFVINFIDQRSNLKNGVNKKPLFSAYTIVSPSMVPSINVLDVIVNKRVEEPEDLKKGDIITFSSNTSHAGITVTHRILFIDKTSDGKYLYTTKGDNNNTKDPARISFDEIYGKVLFRIPKVGYIQYYLSSVVGWVVIIVIPAIMIIGYDTYKLFRNLSKNKK